MRRIAPFFFMLTIGCGEKIAALDEETDEVRNGSATSRFERSVFAQLSVAPAGICTASNVIYDRCLLTAAHCIQNKSLANTEYYAGTRPLVNLATSKRQNPARWDTKPTLGGIHDDDEDSPYFTWADLGVVWLEAKKNLPHRVRLQPRADYRALPIIVPDNGRHLGLTSVAYGSPRAAGEAAVSVEIIGYGHANNSLLSVGTKRIGDALAVAYHQGSLQPHPLDGAIMRVDPDPSEGNRITCQGDSGGPLLSGGELAGVLSAGEAGRCENTSFALYTVLEQEGSFAGPSNYDWTLEAAERLCTQWLNVEIEGSGSVAGSLLPVQSIPFGIENNSEIACPGDCKENFHQAKATRAAQSMNMVASPAAGWRFDVWRSKDPPKYKCQCHGSSDPACFVMQQPMGYYDPNESIDEDDCVAVFVQDPEHDGGVDGGYPPPPSSDDAGIPSYADASEPSYEDASTPTYEDAGEPTSEDAGMPTYEDAGEPTSDDAGEPAYEDASVPSYEDASAEPADAGSGSDT